LKQCVSSNQQVLTGGPAGADSWNVLCNQIPGDLNLTKKREIAQAFFK